MTESRRKVLFVATGGSIAYAARDSLDLVEYGDYGEILGPEDLLAAVPEAERLAEFECVEFRAVSSMNLVPDDWLALARLIQTRLDEDSAIAGVVVTHGTASIEETAYFLHLTLRVDVPVVIVGAQRPMGALSSDGPMNLYNGVRVALANDSRGLGTLVVLNDEIQAAREVTKTSTYRLETFQSRDLGMLGYVDPDGAVAIYRRPTRPWGHETDFDLAQLGALPRVDVAYSYPGADGLAIDAFREAGCAGIVLASMAPGKPTDAEADAALRAQEAGIVMIQSCRAGSGRVVARRKLAEQGFVPAGNLNPQKARVLAILALSVSPDPAYIARAFETY